jgi:hypothetical protein
MSAPTQAASVDDVYTQLLVLHNWARAMDGLPVYNLSPLLQQAAQLQADYLASKPATKIMQLGASGHRGPNDNTPAAHAVRLGYTGRRDARTGPTPTPPERPLTSGWPISGIV